MSGMDMLLVNALKAFMPKDKAELLSETLQGMMNDGTFEKIASLPSDVAEITRAIKQQELELAKLLAYISFLETRAPARNPLHSDPERRLVAYSSAECGPREFADGGSFGGSSDQSDNGRGTDLSNASGIEADEIGEAVNG